MNALATDWPTEVPVLAWRGRSGRVHALRAVPVADFTFAPDMLYLLAARGRVLWVGEMAEIVASAETRAGFRAALARADTACTLPAPPDHIGRMTLTWDLTAATPVTRPLP